MIDIGGNNLPKAISSKSGAKLGKIYKKKGLPLNLEDALIQIYRVLSAKPKVIRINDNTYEVILKYPRNSVQLEVLITLPTQPYSKKISAYLIHGVF